MSGGQRQRIMIAISIANNPDLLIARQNDVFGLFVANRKDLQLLKKLLSNYGKMTLTVSSG